MKLNRKRKDARFPNWVLELLASLQIKYQWTFTEALIRCTEKGAAYYNKQWEKMHPNKKGSPDWNPASQAEERCPNEPQNDYSKEESEEYNWKTDPELEKYISQYKQKYGREPSTEHELNDFMTELVNKKLEELYKNRK